MFQSTALFDGDVTPAAPDHLIQTGPCARVIREAAHPYPAAAPALPPLRLHLTEK